MQVNIYGATHTCAKAVKGKDYVFLYDESGNEIVACRGISSFDGYTIEAGEWNAPSPTPEEKLREDVDFLLIAELTREGLL